MNRFLDRRRGIAATFVLPGIACCVLSPVLAAPLANSSAHASCSVRPTPGDTLEERDIPKP